jgi:hypothetical protein
MAENGSPETGLIIRIVLSNFNVILFPSISAVIDSGEMKWESIYMRINFEEGHPVTVAENVYPAPTGLTKAKYI